MFQNSLTQFIINSRMILNNNEPHVFHIPSLLSGLCQSSSQGFLTRGALLEAVPTSEKQS